MAASSDSQTIRAEVDKILASGVLGRSRFYAALLEYLVACGERNHTPKEIEIAADVFNRGNDFDPSQDSMVRVYAHNLRQKLQQYYSEHGEPEQDQITIPKGEYRIGLVRQGKVETPQAPEPSLGSSWGSRMRLSLLVAVSMLAGAVINQLLQPAPNETVLAYSEVAESPLWSAVADDDLPVVLVVGDYYMFGELDQVGNVRRLVREFDIDSSRDLDELFMLQPELASRYLDLQLTYVPSGLPAAQHDLEQVLIAADKNYRVVKMSDFDTNDMRDSHIIYVGYLSRLNRLSDFVFAGSQLAVGETYDELVDLETGAMYISEAGLASGQQTYRDYGLFSTLPGPGGNQLVFVTGTRDEGLMQTAQAVSNPALIGSSVSAVADEEGAVPNAFEVLYEVAGLDRTNLDARIVHAAPLDISRVTVGNLIPGN